MKVIKPGDQHARVRWDIDYGWLCSTCGAVIQIEPDDLEGDMPKVGLHDDQRDGLYFTATCPSCGGYLSGSKGRGIELADKVS